MLNNEITQGILLAILGALAALWVNSRLQREQLRQTLKNAVYEEFSSKITDLNNANVNANAVVIGISTHAIVLRSIHQSIALKIPGRSEVELNAEIRQKWNDYLSDAVDKLSKISGKFTKLHRQVELSFFMYPKLEKIFDLLKEDYRAFINENHTLTEKLWQIDPFALINEDQEKQILKNAGIDTYAEKSIERLVHAEDFIYIMQHELLNNLFKFDQRVRKDVKIGRILTRQGWKDQG